MSSLVEAYEGDMDYLHSRINNPTWEQEEDFLERVAIMIADSNIDETKARELAYKAVIGD